MIEEMGGDANEYKNKQALVNGFMNTYLVSRGLKRVFEREESYSLLYSSTRVLRCRGTRDHQVSVSWP